MEETTSYSDRILSARRDGAGTAASTSGKRADVIARSGRPRWLMFGAGGILLLLVAGLGVYNLPHLAGIIAQANEGTGRQQSDVDSRGQNPEAAARRDDPFFSHANQAGVEHCANTYSALGQALAAGTQFMVQTQTAKSDPNKHAILGLVGMTFPDRKSDRYVGPATGLVFAAPTSAGCEGSMVRIVPFPMGCAETVSLLPKDSAQQKSLSGLSVYALSTGGQAVLMPAGEGCIAVSIVRADG
ncbi:hypothetical protein [Ochrobactrum sp. Marseille-Q0166]|uniref:hypothetical protein n=1 Tax=Ochrobactrum sp. Marseille-Q0166 TaxID=2761105 RepID=UPI0016561508|nr:hypothetical protein [Ochrobactrum sp. Marseille-Q0166]MBC8716391.1 hypothetical protein [Ochrobactrum sp. Marseille-Q0166]